MMAEKVVKFSYLEDSVIINIVGENNVPGSLLILVVFLRVEKWFIEWPHDVCLGRNS